MKWALIAFGNEESYGLLFVGGELLHHDQQIKYFDAEMQDIVTQVIDWKPDFVAFSPMTTFFPAALDVCTKIKKQLPNAVSVWGGHHAIADPTIEQLPDVDIVVVGPVRGSIPKILNGSRGTLKIEPTEPSDIPLPARRQYYSDIPRMARRYRKIMLSMLGCPWNCSYCSSSCGHMRDIFGAKAHKRYYLGRRPLEHIIAEAKEIITYPTDEIEWVDDDMFCSPDTETWIPDFVDTWVKEINLPMYISTTSHFTLKVSDNVLKKLRDIVNCVGVGVQAIRPESLKLFNRQWDSEEKLKAAYDRLVSFGYRVNLQAIIGLPVPDPVDDALETVTAMQRIGPGSVCSVYPLQIYPGTGIRQYAIDNGYTLNETCSGDTNTGISGIAFDVLTTKHLRNICKLATMFVEYGVEERWMRALIDIDFTDEASRNLSIVRYHDCVVDRLKEKGEQIYNDILKDMNIRY
jgi:radical SAM superfamily enzyme YgiQ (UPF0313 family)